MSGMNDNSAFSAFDRMSEKVEIAEAKADATAELAEDFAGGNADLDKEFAALASSNSGTDDDLARMKAEMGLLEEKKTDTPKLDAPK
jgi:phage shock protein A